jgi:dTDP-4-dehydrorhamnose reductase
MKELVIGGTGQLARHLRAEFPQAEFWDRTTIDLSNQEALAAKLAAVRPTAIINAAAYTAVDKAESEPEMAWSVNAQAPASLARAANRQNIPLVHVSTDYVFDGCKVGSYVESDPVRPLGVYGRTKLGGELAVASLCRKHWILRTSWVFSEHGHNFPKTMLRLARERDELRVVEDQIGRPTYAAHLARAIHLVRHDARSGPAIPWGVHHVEGGRALSWKAFADAVIGRAAALNLIASKPRIMGITTAEYPTPAARPGNSVLQSRESTARYTRDPFDWEAGLDQMLRTFL